MSRTNIEQMDSALKVFATILAAFGLIFFYGFQIDAQAHSGGLNSQGCHAGSKPYHCHRSSSEMVGNRLRCDLGSRSKECEQNKPVPKIPDNEKTEQNPPAAISSNSTGSITAGQSNLPSQFQSGIGLKCEGQNEKMFFVFNQNKTVVGEAFFRNDIVQYKTAPVTVNASELTWVSRVSNRFINLNRQSLILRAKKLNYACTLATPSELHKMALEALQKKLGKNQL